MPIVIIISIIFFSVAILALLFCFWALFCNQRTFKEVGIINNAVSIEAKTRINRGELNRWRDLYDQANQVSYDSHFRARLFLKNPWSLYPIQIRQLIRR